MINIISENEKLREAARFFANILGVRKGNIIIQNVNEGDFLGMCQNNEDTCIILLNTDTETYEDTVLGTLAHEMVHVKQYLLGELKHLDCSDEFNGVKYSFPTSFNSLDYWFSPWEVEAYGKQVGLVELYLRKLEGAVH